MNGKKATIVIGLVLLIVALATGYSIAAQPRPQDSQSAPKWPSIAGGEPDSSQMGSLKAALVRVNKAEGPAALNFDLSQLPSVLVDDSAIPLTSEQAKFLQQVREVQGTDAATELSGNGYLTYMKAFYLNWKRGAEGWERIEAKAKAKGRDVPTDEVKAISGVVGFPHTRNNPKDFTSAEDFKNPDYYHIEQAKTNGNWADVTYTAGAMHDRVFFVMTSAGWKEAGRIIPSSNQ